MTHEEILAMLGDYVDYLIANSSAEAPMWNIEKVRSGKPNKWNYIDGCMITACLSLYKTTGDEKYLNFSKSFIDSFVQEDGSIKTYDPKEYNLDNVNQGKNLFTLYDIFGDEKYRKAIETIRSQLATQPRTKEGNFWHKDIYPWQVWLDGTYMAQPFYMEYETRFNKMQGCIDSYKQFMNIKKHMRDEKTGLYYHGYDESRQMYWADPVTGCSPNFWLRAMGWFMVAMVDVLERMDEQLYNEYRGIMAMLKQTIEDVHKFQDEETGMFWQVMDHPGVEGNYLETSGTALFAYAVLKGVRLGYLPKRMAAWAEKAFYGTCDKYLSKNPDGSLQLDGICLVAGLGGKDHRDGSLAYYFSEPVVCNDAKGVGPLVLAYTEMIARMGDHRIGCGKDVFGGAVIFLQLDHLCILKFLLEFQDIADISSAETVNALVIVSDYTEVLVFIRQHTDDLELYKVCILILIDHDVLELLLVGMKDMRVILKQLDGLP